MLADHVRVCHVPSHLNPQKCSGPFDGWILQWNGHADTVAGLMNLKRDADLKQLWESANQHHVRQRRVVRELRGLYCSIAHSTQRFGSAEQHDEEAPDLAAISTDQQPPDIAERVPIGWREHGMAWLSSMVSAR